MEITNLGPVMDEAVVRAKRRMRVGASADYDLLYENFDVLHYLLQAQPLSLIDDPTVDLIEHFLKNGRAKGLSPHPDFSMVEYVNRYPRKTARDRVRNPYLVWLKRGRAAGDIADPAPGIQRMAPVLGMTSEQLADLMGMRRRDLQQRFRTGRLGEVLARAAEIEPLIGETWAETARPRLVPLTRAAVVDETCAIYEAQEAAGFRRARVVFVIKRFRWGGGRRLEGHIAHALAAHVRPDEIVVIYTDESREGTTTGRYPAGVREIDFARIVRGMPSDSAQHVLVMLLRTFQADAIVNIDSKLLYHAMRYYGRALAATERLFLVFFCNDRTAMGTLSGFSLQYVYRTFDDLAGVITDSEYLSTQIAEKYRIGGKDRERLHVFRAPVDAGLPVVSESPARAGRRPQVFWAGRWDRQKRVGLFLEISRLMPDVDFRMWGESVLTSAHVREVSDNVRVEGPYAHISEIPLTDADVWLYTSAWDGVPSQLLEVAMTGIPIVGSLVGGTGEVLSDEDAWPVAEGEGAEAYVAAIRAALADPDDSRRRALALRERMLRERTEKAFATLVADVLLGDDRRGRVPDEQRLRSEREASLPHEPQFRVEAAHERGEGPEERPTTRTDLTLVVTAHNETLVSGPTMTAADVAVEAARAAGHTVQTIIALDKATEATTNYFHQACFDHWERWIMDEGDLGRVRNALVPMTSGRFIAFLDADDLFSENWLAEGLAILSAAEERGEHVIAHPEVNMFFDGTKFLLQTVDQDSPVFTPHHLYTRNCYDSLCLAPREAHLAVPYVHRDIPHGLSFQDWQFAVETMARGWKHVVVQDTIIFKRRRDFSLNVESLDRKSIIRSLPEMAIDRIRDLTRATNRSSV